MDQVKNAGDSTLAWGSPWDESGMSVSVGATMVMIARSQWLTPTESRGPVLRGGSMRSVGDTEMTPAAFLNTATDRGLAALANQTALSVSTPPPSVSHQNRQNSSSLSLTTYQHTAPSRIPPPTTLSGRHKLKAASNLESQVFCGSTANMADAKKDEATKSVQVEALVRNLSLCC